MVLTEFQEAGMICMVLKEKYEKELSETAARCEEERKQRCEYLEALSSALRLLIVLERGPAGVLQYMVQYFTCIRDPGAVLRACFNDHPLDVNWLRRLRGAFTILTYEPYGSFEQKEFVRKTEEALDAAEEALAVAVAA